MKIKICSANIRFENDHDGINSWKNRLPLLSEFIIKNNFALIGTQEGRIGQLKELESIVPLTMIDAHRKWIPERMYPTLFINQDEIEIMKSGDIWLSETPDIPGSIAFNSAFPRLATWTKIKWKFNLEQYLVINVHLDHVLPETRLAQANVIILECQKLNKENLSIILMGDFNDDPQSATYNLLQSKLELYDPWSFLGQKEETSYHGFKGQNDEGSRIDWILCSQNIQCEKIHFEKKSKKLKNNDIVFLSDHFPLVATLMPK